MQAQETRGVAERTSYAAAWLVAARTLAKGFDLITLLVLTRILAPSDFGLVALAMTFVLIVESVLEIPVAAALVRARTLTPRMLDTAFTLSFIRGGVVALLLVGAASPVAAFYNEPRLAPLIAVLSLAPALRSLVSPKMAVFGRDLNFWRDFTIEVVGKAAAFAFSIVVAMTTKSYWAIAVGTLTTPIVMMLVSYVVAPYRPRLSVVEWRSFADILSWNTLSQVAMAVNWQLDRILLGRFVTDALLGFYVVAQTLTATPYQMIVVPIVRPFTAAFRLKSDNASSRAAYLKASAAVFTLVAPVLVLLAILAEPLIAVLVGDEWRHAAVYVQWLAATGVIRVSVAPVNGLLLSRNKTKFIAFQSLLELGVKLPAAIYAIIYFGVMGAIASRALGFVIVTASAMIFLRQVIGLGVRKQIGALIRPLCGLSVLIGVAWLAEHLLSSQLEYGSMVSRLLNLVAIGGAGGLSYFAVVYGLWRADGEKDGIEKVFLTVANGIAGKVLKRQGAR